MQSGHPVVLICKSLVNGKDKNLCIFHLLPLVSCFLKLCLIYSLSCPQHFKLQCIWCVYLYVCSLLACVQVCVHMVARSEVLYLPKELCYSFIYLFISKTNSLSLNLELTDSASPRNSPVSTLLTPGLQACATRPRILRECWGSKFRPQATWQTFTHKAISPGPNVPISKTWHVM